MSFKKAATYAATPATARGVSTKLSASKDKVIYTNGKTVVVHKCGFALPYPLDSDTDNDRGTDLAVWILFFPQRSPEIPFLSLLSLHPPLAELIVESPGITVHGTR